jgi:hypothetical protein
MNQVYICLFIHLFIEFLDRETIVRRDRSSPTLAETHLICKEGSTDSFYSEEHWSSEVSAFVTTSPPKFLQVILSTSHTDNKIILQC